MGVVQLPDELQLVIEQQVAQGRAADSSAFVEEAIRRLVDEAKAEEDDLLGVVEAASADIQAGRHTTVATEEDERRAFSGMMTRLRTGLSAGS